MISPSRFRINKRPVGSRSIRSSKRKISDECTTRRRLPSGQRQARPLSRSSSTRHWLSSHPNGLITPHIQLPSPSVSSLVLHDRKRETSPHTRYASVRPVSTSRKKTPSSQSMRSPGSKMRRSNSPAAGSMHSMPRQGSGVGVGTGVGEGVAVGVAVGVGDGGGVASGVGVGTAVRVGTAVGDGVTVRATVAVAAGVAVTVGGGVATGATASPPHASASIASATTGQRTGIVSTRDTRGR